MIFKEPFSVTITPFYHMNHKFDETEKNRLERLILEHPNEFTQNGDILSDNLIDIDLENRILNGGPFNWAGVSDNETQRGVTLQLMRVWCTQMVQQMIMGIEYVNEIDSKIGLAVGDDERKIALKVCRELLRTIHMEMEKNHNSLTIKKKPKKLNF